MFGSRFSRLATVAVSGVLMCTAFAGCTGEPEASPGPPVVVPGGPGEPNQTMSTAPEDSSPANAADLAFLADMIVHHAQAVQMAELVPDRAADPVVRRLAGRILDAQQPEIDAMSGMLTERGGEVPSLEHHEHEDHSGMPGMASPAELVALERASGEEFDRMFLRLMIRHHRGALTMAREQLAAGSDVRVGEVATDIAVTQTKEISVMADRQRELAG